MRNILGKPGFISSQMGGNQLRQMFQMASAMLDPRKLSPLAQACMMGHSLDAVKEILSMADAPDIKGSETPFQLGYVSLVVLGVNGHKCLPPCNPEHLRIVEYLVQSGAPLDLPDIAGHTALHHACTPPDIKLQFAKLLLQHGANVNAQNRYGEVPLFFALQGGDAELTDLLMEHGANMDIQDANGDSPRKMYIIFGPEVTATIRKWERRQAGEVAAPCEARKRCESCGTEQSGLRQCARCHTVRYCSVECQRAHWPAHRPNCRAFSPSTTVTLKPQFYDNTVAFSTADFVRGRLGLSRSGKSADRPGTQAPSSENRRMIVKIQVPVSSTIGLLIYNRQRDFSCIVHRNTDPDAYDTISQIVRSKGVGGKNGHKAYFAAELRGKNELVVKVSEVLAEQPF
ncbi:ankyrin repeat-containing domain protein [Pisolithus thermaeus]|nr:ankyrin repeat-containing domain protein [Pisolithus thermaeus]